MYNLLEEAARIDPIPGNAGGSYLTMRSKSGLIFGVINVSEIERFGPRAVFTYSDAPDRRKLWHCLQ